MENEELTPIHYFRMLKKLNYFTLQDRIALVGENNEILGVFFVRKQIYLPFPKNHVRFMEIRHSFIYYTYKNYGPWEKQSCSPPTIEETISIWNHNLSDIALSIIGYNQTLFMHNIFEDLKIRDEKPNHDYYELNEKNQIKFNQLTVDLLKRWENS